MKVQVLGKGCGNCELTTQRIQQAAHELGISIDLEKVQDFQKIAAMGVMRTPAVAIEGRVLHSGSVPALAEIREWLAEQDQ